MEVVDSYLDGCEVLNVNHKNFLQDIASCSDNLASRGVGMHVHHMGRKGRAGGKDGIEHTLTQSRAQFDGKLVNSLVATG